MKTVVIEGGDGAGKTTLARALATEISKYAGYEGYYLRFPSDGIDGFRNFFLAQNAERPTLDSAANEVSWRSGYKQTIPPLTNLLHITADFNYGFNALLGSPAVAAVYKRKAQPVFVIDRELLSTIVYQILYPYALDKADLPQVVHQRNIMCAILRTVAEANPVHKHSLLIFLDTAAHGCVPQRADVFDGLNQDRLGKHFMDLYMALGGEEGRASLDCLNSKAPFFATRHIDWLRERFPDRMALSAFSDTSANMAAAIAKKVCDV